jgi:hypothetical protein
MVSEEKPQEAEFFGHLKKPINEIIKLTESLDERYRVKCFEILLGFYLQNDTRIQLTPQETSVSPEPKTPEKRARAYYGF